MRNRPDIGYLTILGLSLTVVFAIQKGDNCEDSVRFKLSDADGHHICFLSVDAVRDAFLAVSQDKSSFVFGHTAHSFNTITSSIKVLVNTRTLGFSGMVSSGMALDKYPIDNDFTPDFGCAPVHMASAIKVVANADFNTLEESPSMAVIPLSAIEVRAGPKRIV